MDQHGNIMAEEGCTRCACGAKYWERDVCVSCGMPLPGSEASYDHGRGIVKDWSDQNLFMQLHRSKQYIHESMYAVDEVKVIAEEIRRRGYVAFDYPEYRDFYIYAVGSSNLPRTLVYWDDVIKEWYV